MVIDNEKIRETIRETINEAIKTGKPNVTMAPELEFMLTSICFLMYKQGMKDGLRVAETTMKTLQTEINK